MNPTPRQLKVLLVDNHPDTLTYLSRYVEQLGYRTFTASDVDPAMAILGAEQVDILISDIKLPSGDGWELLRSVKEERRPSFCIAMSGYNSPSDIRKSVETGYRHHLVKPFLPTDLDVLLEEASKEIAGK